MRAGPRSCDTFVAFSPGKVVFGKNSDRPTAEAQPVVAFAARDFSADAQLQCTYIAIPQVQHTYACVLSKIHWMWGAEMAANERGVVMGNEAVWTKEPHDGPEALLGMDIVRLVAERCATAAQGVSLVGELLATHGQGGSCEQDGHWTYHNSFLIADHSEAWVVETAGIHWCARVIREGTFNISNVLSIGTQYDRCSEGLEEYARDKGYWDGAEKFHWSACFSADCAALGEQRKGREAAGRRLLQSCPVIGVREMRDLVMRDTHSGICMETGDGEFRTNGAQISVLSEDATQNLHYFTGTQVLAAAASNRSAFTGCFRDRARSSPRSLLWHSGASGRSAAATWNAMRMTQPTCTCEEPGST